MNKIITLCAFGFLGLGLAGCATQDQTAPTTAQMTELEGDVKKPVEVAGKPADAATAKEMAVAMNAPVAPFSLPDTDGKTVEVGNWDKSKATVIMFVATQCPVSNEYNERMEKLATNYGAKGVKFVGVNSNKQENSAEIAEHSRKNGFTFAVLKDQGNAIADRFAAKVTPEIYVVSSKGELVYHGQIDNAQNQSKVKTRPLAAALDAVLANQPVKQSAVAAFGCSIKREG